MTPLPLAQALTQELGLAANARVLEPSFGQGAFLIALIDALLGPNPTQQRFEHIMRHQVFGVEIDPDLYAHTLRHIEDTYWPLPEDHNLSCGDFFQHAYPLTRFDAIVGNPPFGGTFDPTIEDELDRRYGRWNGHKVKKETYAFFITHALDMLAEDGQLRFILSDTFLTISTMAGLRHRLADQTRVDIRSLGYFSEETNQPMVVLTATRGTPSDHLTLHGVSFARTALEKVGKFSWGVSADLLRYFNGPTLGDYIQCSSGMTVGANELFIRPLDGDRFVETHDYIFFDDPITLAKEIDRARLGKLSAKKRADITALEDAGATRRNVRVLPARQRRELSMPHPDYRYYNKAIGEVFYAAPRHVIFWKDEGDAVLTFKKNGNWYLHGVGGARFFGREGITWQLIGNQIRMRYLPPGYILDSGAPCGFLHPEVGEEELWFILAWTNTTIATRILKGAINHTRNIQSKDIERLPYPWWVNEDNKHHATRLAHSHVHALQAGHTLSPQWREELDELFAFPTDQS